MELMETRRKLLLSIRGDNVQHYINNLLTSGTAMTKGYIDSSGSIVAQSGVNKELTTDYFAIDNSKPLLYVCRIPKSGSVWIGVSLYNSGKAFLERPSFNFSAYQSYNDGTHKMWIGQLAISNIDAAYARMSFRTYGDCLMAIANQEPNINALANLIDYDGA